MSRKKAYYSDEDFDSDEEYISSHKNRRPKSARVKSPRKRAASAGRVRPSSSAGKTARELWLNAVKSGHPETGKRKKTSVEAWSDMLRKTGVGITTETTNHQSFSGLPKGQSKAMAYSSTSHYLRQLVGTEKTRKIGDVPVMNTARSAPGTPAYKSPEEYYDDILELKKQISALNNENSTMKSKVRRLEEDNLKKEREIEQLLDPSKSDELRRTLADRKPDAGAVIHSLKQKILKLEHTLRDKEAAHNKLQSDLKTTKSDEAKIQVEALYQEVIRLNQLKTVEPMTNNRQMKNGVTGKESSTKLKALQQTILRMNEKNVTLMTENKTLKEDLEKMLQDKAENRNKQSEYEDMSKRQLLGAISKLEKKLDRSGADTESLMSDIDGRKGAVEGKIVLEGTVAQKLDQLDRRETELLEEAEKQRGVIKRLKDDRVHYRKKTEEKEKEIKTLKREIEDIQAELDGFYDKDKSSITPRSARQSQTRSMPPGSRGASSRRSMSPSVSSDSSNVRNSRKVRQFRENHAAKTIQRGWRDHRQNVEQDEAAELIGSAMRGHLNRKKQLGRYSDHNGYADDDSVSQSEDDLDDAAALIQSSFNGHRSRKNALSKRGSSPSPNRRGHYKRLDSAGEEDDDDDDDDSERVSSRPSRGTNNKRQSFTGRTSPLVTNPRNKPPASPHRKSSYRTNRYDDDDDEEEDSDSVIVSSKRR